MQSTVEEFKNQARRLIDQLKEELKTIRTGRANPVILEEIIVETYGGQTKLKLKELASITGGDPSALVITPYDPSTLTDVEKAILKSPVGLTPQVQGTKIIVRIPPLSQEQRQKLAKLIGQKTEEKKAAIRNLRDDARRKFKHGFEEKSITEDEKFKREKDIDASTQQLMSEVQEVKERKEKDIMEV